MAEQPSWQDVLDLISQLNESSYESASVQVGDVSIRLSRSDTFADVGAPAPVGPVHLPASPSPAASGSPVAAASSPGPAAPPSSSIAGETIDAPMIGVFYRRPSPGSDPFVEPGQRVEADTTIGIIEIMKLMNPIAAGKAGVITAFLADDAEAVEFGQPLAAIDTSA